MILLQRSIKALRYHWKRTLLVIAVYTALFSLLLLMAVLNISSEQQIRDTQMGIGNSVLVRKVRLEDLNIRDSLSMFKEEEVQTLTTDARVASYNLLVKGGANLTEGTPYIADQALYDDLLKRSSGREERADNAQFIGVTDSQYSVFFSGAGFCLIDGSGITRADEGQNVVLISEKVAAINGWHVGDRIALATTKNYGLSKGKPFEAEIKGIYACPEDSFIRDTIEYTPDSLPENYIFIPQTTITAMEPILCQVNMVFLYLQNPDLIESYIADMRAKLGDVAEDITQRGWHVQFRYTWDEEWNQIVSAPFQEISRVTGAAMAVILLGTLAVVILISSGELREKRKELGVWLACGERKGRILTQTLLEKLFPIIVAGAAALTISLAAAGPVSRMIVSDTSEQFNRQIQEQRQEVGFWEICYIMEVELRAGNYDYFYVSSQVDLYRSRGAIAGAACRGLGLLGVVLAMQIFLAMGKDPRTLLGDTQ